jgi:amino acid transporter
VNLGWLGHFIAFGITCSMFACALACLTAGSRMLLSLGHDGLLPRFFTHTSRHTHAPSVAIWVVAIPMTLVPVAYIAAGSTDTILTGEMGTLATYGFMLAYALVALAAPVYLKKIGAPKPLAWFLGILGMVTMVFVFYVNWIPQAISNDIFPALAWPYRALPYVFLGWTAIGLAWYGLVRLRNPGVVANAGAWGEHAEPAREAVGG